MGCSVWVESSENDTGDHTSYSGTGIIQEETKSRKDLEVESSSGQWKGQMQRSEAR